MTQHQSDERIAYAPAKLLKTLAGEEALMNADIYVQCSTGEYVRPPEGWMKYAYVDRP